MRKILVAIFILTGFIAKAQVPVERASNATIPMDANLFTHFNFKIPVYADTTAANLYRWKDSLGLLIKTPQGVYVRDSALGSNKWSLIQGDSGAVSSVFGRTGAVTATSGDYSAYYPLLATVYTDPVWIGTLSASKISSAGNVTAGSTKISLGGTPSGAGLQNFSIDVNQANLNLASIGGLLGVSQINATGTPSSSTVLYGDGTWGAASGGGTGLPNSNVGTGYRWAIPTTNNIKTAFGRGYIVLDSSSNTNGITFYPDTSSGKLATKTDVSRIDSGIYVNNTITKTITGKSIGLKVDTTVIATKSYVDVSDSLVLRTPGTGTGAIPIAYANGGALVIPKIAPGSGISFSVASDSLLTISSTGGGGGSGGIGVDSVVTITSGTSSTVTNGYNVVQINPSSLMASYTLTLPTTWHTSKDVLIVFGGTITSGNPVITSLTIVNGSGQTLVQANIPGSFMSGDVLRYHLVGTIDYRITY